ncbi:MAG: M28 family peptidase [Lentisphaeria bacterium]|nr:M28 family peptidase [Lentisphaeria bacterium]
MTQNRITVFLFIVTINLLISCLPDNANDASVKRNNIYEVSTSQLNQYVKYLSEDCFPRNVEHIENLNKSAKFIHDHFQKNSPYEVERQFYEISGITFENVVARFGPRDKPKLIIGAHYDSCGSTPGADDNASGIAGLIALAQMLKEKQLLIQIELVAYSTEEPPYFGSHFMGSYIHAKSIGNDKNNIVGMICLEMIGYFSDEPNSQEFPLSSMKSIYPTTGNFIAIVGRVGEEQFVDKVKTLMIESKEVPVETVVAPSMVQGVDFSDHRNYWKFDIPALMITDTAFYRNNNYHKMTDTSDTLNYNKMQSTINSIYYLLVNWAE